MAPNPSKDLNNGKAAHSGASTSGPASGLRPSGLQPSASPSVAKRTSSHVKEPGHAVAVGAKENLKNVKLPVAKADVIHLGIDVHLRNLVTSRQIDGATPQPVQAMTADKFKEWVAKQQTLAHRVVCCYEAGPFGYGLYRHLMSTGVECHVVRPQNWDTFGQKVKTDERDARALVEALARFEGGNKNALAIVRAPEPDQEQRRALSRQREMLVRQVRRMGAWGRGTGLTHGHQMSGRWWRAKPWALWEAKLEPWLVSLLDPIRLLIVQMEAQVLQSTQQIEAMASPPQQRPKGVGALTEQIINNEVIDWRRFNNRNQVASYTGLCPSEHSSGGSRRQGSINRHGNPRLRHALVEAVWRLMQFQPQWKRFARVKERLELAGKSALRRKIIVGLARELAIDLWRLNTGRATLEDLGLEPATHAHS